jgi:hypothetical protein
MWTWRWAGVIGIAVVVLWAAPVLAGGWAPVDVFVTQGSNTMRTIFRFVLGAASVGLGGYFFATRGFDTVGIGSMVGLGIFAMYIIGVMDPIINSIAAAAELEDVQDAVNGGRRLCDPDSAVPDQDATLGQSPGQADDRQPDVLDVADDQCAQLALPDSGRGESSRAGGGDEGQRACGGDVVSAYPVPCALARQWTVEPIETAALAAQVEMAARVIR